MKKLCQEGVDADDYERKLSLAHALLYDLEWGRYSSPGRYRCLVCDAAELEGHEEGCRMREVLYSIVPVSSTNVAEQAANAERYIAIRDVLTLDDITEITRRCQSAAEWDAALDEAISVSAGTSFENKGIKNHEGQKLLVQHILDNDKGLSDSSRMILEKLIEE